MIDILKQHLKTYPHMQIQDIAKLLYQSEFGGGHFVADSRKSLQRIQEEFQTLDAATLTSFHDIEPIGGGIYRLYLSTLSNGLSADVFNQLFVQSASHKRGTIEQLEQKISDFLTNCENGTFPFSSEEAHTFFATWKSNGYPAISHSDHYKRLYKPAYRVVDETCIKVYHIIQDILSKKPSVLAIDGMSASGKTTLGNLLHLQFPNSNLFHMDDYFLQPHQRTESRLTEVGGNVDYERFYHEIIQNLKSSDGITYHKFDCKTQTLSSEIVVSPKPLTIIEGAYSLHPYFGTYYDLCYFYEISKETQRQRILSRNGEEMLQRFEKEWIPKEHAYFEHFQIQEKSGLLQ